MCEVCPLGDSFTVSLFFLCLCRKCSGTRATDGNIPKMSYKDFIWFLLSEEDKTSPKR